MLMIAVTMVVSSGAVVDLTDEGLVDLQGIDRKSSQIAQARVTRAEIIDGELHAAGPQCFENFCCRFGALHQNAFGQLQLESARIQTEFRAGW